MVMPRRPRPSLRNRFQPSPVRLCPRPSSRRFIRPNRSAIPASDSTTKATCRRVSRARLLAGNATRRARTHGRAAADQPGTDNCDFLHYSPLTECSKRGPRWERKSTLPSLAPLLSPSSEAAKIGFPRSRSCLDASCSAREAMFNALSRPFAANRHTPTEPAPIYAYRHRWRETAPCWRCPAR